VSDAVQKVPKVAREAAELEIDIWCEALGHAFDDQDAREKLISALMDGRITFDGAAETFTYKLRTPIELETGVRLPEVKVSDITAKQYADAFKSIKVDAKDRSASVPMDSILLQASGATGLPLGVVQRIKMRDFAIVQALMGFFG
jgi:hypothetical protein